MLELRRVTRDCVSGVAVCFSEGAAYLLPFKPHSGAGGGGFSALGLGLVPDVSPDMVWDAIRCTFLAAAGLPP